MHRKVFGAVITNRSTVCSCQLRKIHAYKNEPTNSHDLARELAKNAYKTEGFIILNKPHGISFSNPNVIKSEKKNVTPGDYVITLTSLLPHLKELLGTPNLYLVKAPEKYISGVSIFCTDEQLLVTLKKQFLKMRELRNPSDVYLALTVGTPMQPKGFFNGAITLKSKSNSKEKKAMMITEWSNNSVRRGETKRVTISHSTLLSNEEDVSLIEVSSTRNSWHCVRMYLASRLLTPVLGDNLFGSRVKTVLGTPVTLDVFSPAAQLPQKLPNNVSARLELVSRQDVAVPLHLHLSRVKVMNFLRKGNNLSFEVPPPQHFVWSCRKLGLEQNNTSPIQQIEQSFISCKE